MTKRGTGRRVRTVLRLILGAVVCLLAIEATINGLSWFWGLAVFCGGSLLLLGRRRIFRPGVVRTSDGIICRYVPWFEGNAYFLIVALPLMGIASVAAGFAPGNPTWLRYSGILLLLVTPLLVFSIVRMWRRCFLRITASALVIQLAAPKDEPIEISREYVRSIAPKVVPNGVSGESLQVEITYRAGDSDDESPRTVLLGLQLTVEPVNLLSALTAWKDLGHETPSELLDRVEGTLRGRSAAQV